MNFRCDPIPGHQGIYWYQQMLGQGPKYLTYFQGEEEPDKSGMPNNRFSAERPEGTYSYLKIESAEPGDSAVYLCASSLTTAWHTHLLPVHKPLLFTSLHGSQKCQEKELPVLPSAGGVSGFGASAVLIVGGQKITFERLEHL